MATQVFQALEQMDVNGDGKVTLEEMTNYFAVAKSLFPTTAQFIEVRAVPSPPSCVYSAVQMAKHGLLLEQEMRFGIILDSVREGHHCLGQTKKLLEGRGLTP